MICRQFHEDTICSRAELTNPVLCLYPFLSNTQILKNQVLKYYHPINTDQGSYRQVWVKIQGLFKDFLKDFYTVFKD